MLRTDLIFREFYDLCRSSATLHDYRVIITLVARDADATLAYDELLARWSSLHDLTGAHIAFIFAASGRSSARDVPRLAWQQSGVEYHTPGGIAVASPERLLLHYDWQSGRGSILTPEAPDRNELATSHTLRIGEIKSTLGIAERDIPCLHFYFVSSGAGRAVPLSEFGGSLYAYVKCLVTEWESSFSLEAERRRIRQEAAAAAHVEATKAGQARRRLRDVESMVPGLDSSVAECVKSILTLIPQIAKDRSARVDAFTKLRSLRASPPITPSTQRVLSQLNALIDVADKLQQTDVAASTHPELTLTSDEALMQAFTTCHTTATRAAAAEVSWGIFIAHAGADAKLAERLFDLLSETARPFLDSRCLSPGDDWHREIPRAQRQALITVVLVSDATDQAWYERDELVLAISQARYADARHRVIPVLLPGIPPSAMPYGLHTRHHIAMSTEADLAEVATKILSVYHQCVARLEGTRHDAV